MSPSSISFLLQPCFSHNIYFKQYICQTRTQYPPPSPNPQFSSCNSLQLFLASSHAPGPSPIFINIVLMIPDGLTCTLWGRSVSAFFQRCVGGCLCLWVHVSIVVSTFVHTCGFTCSCKCLNRKGRLLVFFLLHDENLQLSCPTIRKPGPESIR